MRPAPQDRIPCAVVAGQGNATDWAEVLPHTDTVLLCTKAMDRRLYFSMVQLTQRIMFAFADAVAHYEV